MPLVPYQHISTPLKSMRDVISEGLPARDVPKWLLRFHKAAKGDPDLSRVHWRFLAFVMHEVLSHKETTTDVVISCRDALDIVCTLARGEFVESAQAAKAQECAAAAAGKIGAYCRANGLRKTAAWNAARTAEAAVSGMVTAATNNAVKCAGKSAAKHCSMTERRVTAAQAKAAAWRRYADKLIELMEAAQ